MLKRLGIALVVIVLAVGGWTVAWRYDVVPFGVAGQRVTIRTHLVTGKSERLTEYGWIPVTAPLDPKGDFNGAFAGLH